ncbi:MAG: DUF501 domain-containing protein, partial [Actinobacteria bacterium]|nr:DUF501 domain-containing protein [Actinomycetota bacterium]
MSGPGSNSSSSRASTPGARPTAGVRAREARATTPSTVWVVDDRAAAALQLGRTPRAFHRVAARCPFGRPAVTEQEPYDVDGRPFPTMYYLTCRALVASVSRLEAAGGVECWTARLAADESLRADHDRATEE